MRTDWTNVGNICCFGAQAPVFTISQAKADLALLKTKVAKQCWICSCFIVHFHLFFFILFQQQGFKASIVPQRCVSFVATSILQSLRILPFLHLLSSLKVQKPSTTPISWSSAMYAPAQSNKLDWEKKSAQQWNQFAEYQKIFLVFCNSLCLGCGSMSQSANGCVFFSVFNNVSGCCGWQESALFWNYSSTRRGEWHTISTICYKKTEFQQSMMQ